MAYNELVGKLTHCAEHREPGRTSRDDRGAEFGRVWLDQRQRALDESKGRCTRCGSEATTFGLSLTGVPVARCRSCHVVDLAAAARARVVGKREGEDPLPGPIADTAGRAHFHARGSGGHD